MAQLNYGDKSSKSYGMKNDGLGTIRDTLKNPSNLAKNLKSGLKKEADMLSEEFKEVKNFAGSVVSNWKIVVPAVAVVGAGLFFLSKMKSGAKKIADDIH